MVCRLCGGLHGGRIVGAGLELCMLDEEQQGITQKLAEFDGYKTGAIDPATGQPTAEKIYRYQGDRRRALENRLGEIVQEEIRVIDHQMHVEVGP